MSSTTPAPQPVPAERRPELSPEWAEDTAPAVPMRALLASCAAAAAVSTPPDPAEDTEPGAPRAA